MTFNRKKVALDLQFIVPEASLLDFARQQLDSADQDCRDVAKALLDTTDVTVRTKDTLAENIDRKQPLDLAPYFDHWIGDAIEAAQRLLSSETQEARNMAKCLIEQSQAIAASKESFLKEAKRVRG